MEYISRPASTPHASRWANKNKHTAASHSTRVHLNTPLPAPLSSLVSHEPYSNIIFSSSMPISRLTVGAIAVALAALSFWSLLPAPTENIPPVAGVNNTALFLVSSDLGLSNVHVATAQALLERHPHIQLHFGSFAPMASRLERVSSYSRSKRGIEFHQLKGSSVIDACHALGKNNSNSIHPPGWAGIGQLCKDMQMCISPWSGEAHLALYEQITHIIDTIDPAVVVLDTLFRPAIDATRDRNRLHAIISPNTLSDTFLADQPWSKLFWKYPAYVLLLSESLTLSWFFVRTNRPL